MSVSLSGPRGTIKQAGAGPLTISWEGKPMRNTHSFHLFFLVFSLAVAFQSTIAQVVIATVPVGTNPIGAAVNSVTNKIYVANQFCTDFPCPRPGTVTVIDGATNNTTTVNVGVYPGGGAVNPVTNKIYVANECGNDLTCNSPGTVTVIDGATNNTTTVNAGIRSLDVAVNSVTNKIYVVNEYCKDVGLLCGSPGTVTVIDGASNNTTTVDVGVSPIFAAVDPVTNKIYVANYCGNDVNCQSFGTATVIDGATNNTMTVNVGAFGPFGVAVNAVTNKVYVVNVCGNDPNCASPGTVTVIDGVTDNTTSVNVGAYPFLLALDSVTNKIYVVNAFCNKSPTLSCSSGPGTVTVIDGATKNTVPVAIGAGPFDVAVNATTNRIYVPNVADNTVSVIAGASSAPQQFVAVTPCRVVDTRPQYGGGGPTQGGTHQDFPISGAPNCGIPASAAAYSFNVTVVTQGYLSYLTVWPTGQPKPWVSTLNSLDGRIKANAAIVPAGASGD